MSHGYSPDQMLANWYLYRERA